jgi:aryl-alcohol dehydrogenase-like predicted oxidoreductase
MSNQQERNGRTSALVLGTAQWGNAYGITNAVGRLLDAEIAGIVSVAQSWGISAVDTAAGYGDAHARLQPWADAFAITTKVAGADPAAMAGAVQAGLASLGRSSVETLLVHDWDSLSDAVRPDVVNELGELLELGVVSSVGVSVYSEDEVAAARSAFLMGGVPLGAVQVPANAIDRRLDNSQVLGDLALAGVRVQVRSAFLQGLLLGGSGAGSGSVAGGLGAHPDVLAFQAAAMGAGLSPLVYALRHVHALPWATEIVVGVTSGAELDAIATAWQTTAELAPESLASHDLELLDPRRWA